jgi:adenylate kinase family enzyme
MIQYKINYFDASNNIITGGSSQMIIHICGPSGAGKTTLGNKLKSKFGNKIVVKDFDDLRREFINLKFGNKKIVWDSVAYQKYINDFVNKQKKTLIWTGLNHMPWWNKKLYYNTHANHKFYIKLDSETIFKQKCSRYINDVFVDNQNKLIDNFINNKQTIDNIKNELLNECGYKETTQMNQIWNKAYKKQGYKSLSRSHIYDAVCELI